MKSKIDMDITQLNAFYQNDLYILDINYVDKNNPYLTCLCKKCNRYFFVPYRQNLKEIKCKYCNKNNINELDKQLLREQKEEKEKFYKKIYQQNKLKQIALNQKQNEIRQNQIKNNLQIKILQEFKEKGIKLTKEQKEYLKQQQQLYTGSKGEQTIATLLNIYNIPYKREKTFSDLKYSNTNGSPRFDFYVDNYYIIEFDGEQHFTEGFKKLSGKTLEEQQEDDNFKNQYCFDNNIPIIRIPYWHLKDLCIEDLLLETSSFILTKN